MSLRRSSEYKKLKETGKKRKLSSWVLVNYQKCQMEKFRFGVTVSRKVGSAVVRNRLKRWCREYFRKKNSAKKIEIDLNVIFLPQNELFYREKTFREFCSIMDRFLDEN